MRELITHELRVRHLTVLRRRQLTPAIVRITLTGDLDGFLALGPNDHLKVFFPDPATGRLTAPELTPDGVRRPTDGVILSRDYTPRAFRDGETPELDIDFVLHAADAQGGSPSASGSVPAAAGGGPASDWAATAEPGGPLAIAGPRASRLVPMGCPHAVLIADETALPAFSRWLELLPVQTRITAILQGEDESIEDYLSGEQPARASVEWLYRADGPGQLDEAVRSLGALGDEDYVWAAGEATELIPVRRYLRHELGLGRDRLTVEGYWKRGITNLDHHAPIDPSDPD